MTRFLPLLAAALPLALAATQPALAADNNDAVMKALATHSGCFTCHHVEPGSKGPDGMAPIGPDWQDVADKYRGNPDALDALTHTVMTGSNPYASHWKGRVSGLAMPPNAVAVSEADARRLVQWILSLPPAQK
ncbi:c-type cytochrome [Ideonella sp. B7]|uniref:c-type cytochrome n=1 Tax=Ideonella benzenivorans TaxID=2831643 RepID=UPI001CEDC78B|nr:c-type cytochrome [Ideonella benzenivorans]MCA6217291.1 c-type cytochrome [Ideonella benzenivorans]